MAFVMIERIYLIHLTNEKQKVLVDCEKTSRSSSQHQLRIYVVAISVNRCLNHKREILLQKPVLLTMPHAA